MRYGGTEGFYTRHRSGKVAMRSPQNKMIVWPVTCITDILK